MRKKLFLFFVFPVLLYSQSFETKNKTIFINDDISKLDFDYQKNIIQLSDNSYYLAFEKDGVYVEYEKHSGKIHKILLASCKYSFKVNEYIFRCGEKFYIENDFGTDDFDLYDNEIWLFYSKQKMNPFCKDILIIKFNKQNIITEMILTDETEFL